MYALACGDAAVVAVDLLRGVALERAHWRDDGPHGETHPRSALVGRRRLRPFRCRCAGAAGAAPGQHRRGPAAARAAGAPPGMCVPAGAGSAGFRSSTGAGSKLAGDR